MNNKAYFDTASSGLVPVIVQNYDKKSGTITAKVTATRKAYKRGEVITSSVLWIYPRKAVFTRAGCYRLRSYAWYMAINGANYILNPSSTELYIS